MYPFQSIFLKSEKCGPRASGALSRSPLYEICGSCVSDRGGMAHIASIVYAPVYVGHCIKFPQYIDLIKPTYNCLRHHLLIEATGTSNS